MLRYRYNINKSENKYFRNIFREEVLRCCMTILKKRMAKMKRFLLQALVIRMFLQIQYDNR